MASPANLMQIRQGDIELGVSTLDPCPGRARDAGGLLIGTIDFVGLQPKPMELHAQLSDLSTSSVRVIQGIPVTIRSEDDSFVIEWNGLDEFGYGPTFAEALSDFKATIAELYLMLEREENRLAEESLRTLRSLRSYLALSISAPAPALVA